MERIKKSSGTELMYVTPLNNIIFTKGFIKNIWTR